MARGRRFIRSNNNNNPRGVDLDARRVLAIESRHDPIERAPDGLTMREQTRIDRSAYQRRQQPAQAVTMAARPALCHCGSRSFYLRGVRWICTQCNPQPAQPVEARAVVTMPAGLSADDKKELRAAWELIQQKRAADGLQPMPAITKAQPAQQQQPADVYPVNVVFYSLMGIEAARRGSGTGGAFRLWVLFRALDTSGRGIIKRDDLRAFVLSLGVNRMTWKRWYSDAMRLEMFKESRSAAGVWYMVFSNAGIIGAALGCVDGVGRRVTMAARDLVGYGWKARIFAAHETTYNNKPIARETMQKNINVSRSTQKYREARAGVKKITNIATMDKRADHLPGMVEHDRNPGAWFTDKNGVLCRRLPNSYQYKGAAISARGRGRKVNRIIRSILHSQQQSSLSKMGQAQSFIAADEAQPTRETIRLYNLTPEQTKATEKKIQRTGNRKVTKVYEYQRKARKAARVVYWSALAVA